MNARMMHGFELNNHIRSVHLLVRLADTLRLFIIVHQLGCEVTVDKFMVWYRKNFYEGGLARLRTMDTKES